MDKFRFLIIDGYSKASRDQFDSFGVSLAGKLYAKLLLRHMPDAEFDILYTSDNGVYPPGQEELKEKYDAIIWPGCNLTVYHDDDERVQKMTKLTKDGFSTGVPQFGSCWAAQLAVYVAGGEIAPNPKGREMGVARKITLNEVGKKHLMYEGKPAVFDGFISHDDMITKMPEGGIVLSSNEFTPVQSVEVKHEKGVFWATQYHPEYNLHEIARLILAREERLMRENYFNTKEDMLKYSADLDEIYNDNTRKDLRWKYAIDEDLISADIREVEFANWIKYQVIPSKK